jgi:hypothetical protein
VVQDVELGNYGFLEYDRTSVVVGDDEERLTVEVVPAA